MVGGAIQGTAITRLKVPPFVVTLGGLSVFRGLALMISGSGPISGFDEAYRWWGQGRIGPVPVPVIIFLAIAAVAFVVLRYTRYGRQVYAVGGNREAARLAGVNVERVTALGLCDHRLPGRPRRLRALGAPQLLGSGGRHGLRAQRHRRGGDRRHLASSAASARSSAR